MRNGWTFTEIRRALQLRADGLSTMEIGERLRGGGHKAQQSVIQKLGQVKRNNNGLWIAHEGKKVISCAVNKKQTIATARRILNEDSRTPLSIEDVENITEHVSIDDLKDFFE